MASASITVRTTKSGKRYVVRYRLGGRAYPIQHGGSFRTMKEARARRDLIAGELAAGRNPAGVLRALSEQPKTRTFADVFDEFIASRIDVAPATVENYKTHRSRLVDLLGDRDPDDDHLAGRAEGDRRARQRPLPRLPACLPLHAAAGARLRGARPEPGPRSAREASPPRGSRSSSRRARRRWPRSSRTRRDGGGSPSARWSRPGCECRSFATSPGATSTSPAPASASSRGRRARPVAGSRCPSGSWPRSPPPARPTTAPRKARVPGGDAADDRDGDAERVQGRRRPALPPARPAPPLRVGEDRRGRPGHRPGRAARPRAQVADARHVLARALDDRTS